MCLSRSSRSDESRRLRCRVGTTPSPRFAGCSGRIVARSPDLCLNLHPCLLHGNTFLECKTKSFWMRRVFRLHRGRRWRRSRSFLIWRWCVRTSSPTAQHIYMDNTRAAARPAVARLLNAHEDEVALVESTSHALSLVALAIPLEAGDRVLMSDLEFMQVAIPWVQKEEGWNRDRCCSQSPGRTADF